MEDEHVCDRRLGGRKLRSQARGAAAFGPTDEAVRSEEDVNKALQVAVIMGTSKEVARLIVQRADVFAKDALGCTALHHAAAANATDTSVMNKLLEVLSWHARPPPSSSAHRKAQFASLLPSVTRTAQCEAFAMGEHVRLGALSMVLGLEPGVVRMILERV